MLSTVISETTKWCPVDWLCSRGV